MLQIEGAPPPCGDRVGISLYLKEIISDVPQVVVDIHSDVTRDGADMLGDVTRGGDEENGDVPTQSPQGGGAPRI